MIHSQSSSNFISSWHSRSFIPPWNTFFTCLLENPFPWFYSNLNNCYSLVSSENSFSSFLMAKAQCSVLKTLLFSIFAPSHGDHLQISISKNWMLSFQNIYEIWTLSTMSAAITLACDLSPALLQELSYWFCWFYQCSLPSFSQQSKQRSV